MPGLDLEDLQYRKRYDSVQAYCRAKLMMIMFTRDEARRPEADGVTLVAVHPGSMYTDALRDMRREYTRLTGRTEFPQAMDVREGIAPLLRLVIDETCAGDSGSYFVLAERKEPSAAACDARLAGELRHRTIALLETL